jgi:GntR family transcriptional regulator/MocR family aminotransferase
LPRRSRLPSTRTLAELLGVSRGVTAAAYDLLFTRGYLASEPGSGTYVAGSPDPMPRRTEPSRLRTEPSLPAGDADTAIDLRPDQLNTEAYPLAAWRAAWREASFRRPPAHPLPPLGVPELRRAVAEHLLTTRGVDLMDKEIVITGGRAHGLRIVLDALGLYGSQVAVEEPAPPAVHRAAGDGPDRPASLPVDAEGARVEGIPVSCRAAVVSPDAHVPLGHILSAQRRRAVTAWASDTGGHVVEIACDAVFRPEASRLPRPLTEWSAASASCSRRR